MENTQNNQMEQLVWNAIVKTGASKTMQKKSGALYVLQQVEITEGPLAGKVVSAERTLLNSKKEEKDPMEIGAKCVVYLTRLDDMHNPGKKKNFFQIGEPLGATDDELNEILDEVLINA